MRAVDTHVLVRLVTCDDRKQVAAVVFTGRANRMRVISARPMSRNERQVYEKEN